MIDPVTRILPVAPAGPSSAPESGTQGADTGTAPPPAPAALSLEVARGDDGVFVYTLSDPATGAVLAVIPREDVRVGRDGRNLDQRV